MKLGARSANCKDQGRSLNDSKFVILYELFTSIKPSRWLITQSHLLQYYLVHGNDINKRPSSFSGYSSIGYIL